MKTKAKKLTLKSLSVIELNTDLLHEINGGWDTKSQTNAEVSRLTTSHVCATSWYTISTTIN